MVLDPLTAHEFKRHISAGTLRLAFIGMSNAGKSYRSRKLEQDCDFFRYEVDANIQKELGFSDMVEISGWLGYPTSDTYKERAAQYLEAEEVCTHLAHLDTAGKNLVFDTTGSVVYLNSKTRQWLHEDCLIVHIDVGEDSMQNLIDKYFEEPKPVVWGESFSQLEGESEDEALRRCYPELLKDRLVKYRELAHLNISHSALFDTSGEETLGVIELALDKLWSE